MNSARMAPEHVFPAASEDVASVYRELLKAYKPANIGLYGCSAGANLGPFHSLVPEGTAPASWRDWSVL